MISLCQSPPQPRKESFFTEGEKEIGVRGYSGKSHKFFHWPNCCQEEEILLPLGFCYHCRSMRVPPFGPCILFNWSFYLLLIFTKEIPRIFSLTTLSHLLLILSADLSDQPTKKARRQLPLSLSNNQCFLVAQRHWSIKSVYINVGGPGHLGQEDPRR